MEQSNAIEQIRSLENQVFTVTAGKEYKSMMLSPEGLRLCNKRFDTPEAFLEKFAKGGGLMNTVITVEFDKVKHFTHRENSKALDISHKGMGLGMPGDIEFENGETDVHNVMTYLEKVLGYRRTEAQLGAWKAILPNIFYVALAILFTWVMYGMATNPEQEEFSGRRQWFGELMDGFSKMVGPYGVLAIGIGVTGFLGWQLWKKYQNPPVETRLERTTL
ncbi:MAG TPA: hypothetical protein PK228_22415 [Saprospiraceae bacterium]|nr:hypothetical protein [Saprospiraceae bacterium]